MSRRFKTADYAATLEVTVRLGDCLPPDHLARFVVDAMAQLDLAPLYARYGARGGEPYAPAVLLGLLFYGYATGVFSARKIERATGETVPFRYIAGNLHPDHDTIAAFRKTVLPEIKELFVHLLVLAHLAGLLALGNISLEGSKIHADASKSKAASYKRLCEIAAQLRGEVEELFALSESAEQQEVPAGRVSADEIALRQARLARLAEAKAVLAARAQERAVQEQAEDEAKVAARAEDERTTGHGPRGRPPTAPPAGPRDTDQYNLTDPDARIMKNPTNQGFEQHDNGQVAVDQQSLLIVGPALSHHPTDTHEAAPTLAASPPALGTPDAAALDTGYAGPATLEACARRGSEPYIATGREPHHQSWRVRCAPLPEPPPADASPQVQRAYKLQTPVGKAIYGARKCTVEPVIGIIKEVLGFRQFSLRGLLAAAGEWCLVCLAFNLKRLHTLLQGAGQRLRARDDRCAGDDSAAGSTGRGESALAAVSRLWRVVTRRRSRWSVRLACSPARSSRMFSPTNC
jgi:transposase